MLDAVFPWGRPVPTYLSGAVAVCVATEAWEVAAYHALRRRIFCDEQGIFATTDVDEHDAGAVPIVAVSHSGGMPDEIVGVVRVYEASPAVWFGGRLGVSRGYRRLGAVGSALIDRAVRTAHGAGAARFFATVQEGNVRYFERHHFTPVEACSVHGLPHRLMEADLSWFPAETAAAARAA